MLSQLFRGNRSRPVSGVNVRAVALLAVACLTLGSHPLMAAPPPATAGTWTKVKDNPLASKTGNMLLLSDGTVVLQGAEKTNGTSQKWAKLVPDATGNYVNGTWSTMASMNTARAHFSSWVIPDGRLVVLGGQFFLAPDGGLGTWSNTVEIYNPLSDSWAKSTATYPGTALADSPTVLLPSGVIAVGDFFNNKTYLYDPVLDTWVTTGTRSNASELWVTGESWTLLPDQSVISYDNIGSSILTGRSERFSSGAWADAGNLLMQTLGASSTPQLTDSTYNRPSNGGAIGPATLLPNGKVIQFGANGLSAVYDPLALPASAWSDGPPFAIAPALPTLGCDGTAGAMLPNGLFFLVADTLKSQKNPSKLFTYDYTQAPNSPTALINVTPTSPASFASDLGGSGGLFRRTLMLPNGNMLLATGNGPIWELTPTVISPNPQSGWKPTVGSLIVKNSSTSYTINGKRLTGISAGATFGGGFNNSATNYPIIRMTNTANGLVKYARTTNWTPGVANASDPATQSVQSVDFDLPTGFGAGNYTLNVIANGIPSADTPFTVVSLPNYVTVTYDVANQVLTLTGDTDNNNVAISVKNQDLTIAGSGQTQIKYLGTTQPTHKIHFGTNVSLAVSLTIKGKFLGGNDYVTLSGVQAKSVTFDMGSGNDTCTVFSSNIGDCSVTGGAGFDTFGVAASSGFYKGNKFSNDVYLPPF